MCCFLFWFKRNTLLVVAVMICSTKYSLSQQIIYQDILRGGVTGAGFSSSPGYGGGQVDVYIEPGSTIKKAFLITQRLGHVESGLAVLNGITYTFDESNQIGSSYNLTQTGASAVHAIDITSDIDPLQTVYSVYIGPSILSDSCLANCIFGPVYLIIIYENFALPSTAVNIMVNTQPMLNNEYYEFTDITPINSTNPVGFSFLADRLSVAPVDRSYVYFNGNLLGLVGGVIDSNSIGGSGVIGDFYYQNNTLFGLSDDTPDNAMIDADALADVSGLITDLSTTVNFEFEWLVPTEFRYNIYSAFFLVYATTCDTFSVSLLAEDTTICKGDSLQFFASGADSYEWSPSIGLSCDDCPNPKISPQQSTTYFLTSTKYGNCKKTQPIKIRVNENPLLNSFNLTTDTCGENSGAISNINASGVAPLTFSLNGNSSSSFSNLQSGWYDLSVTDVNGCKDDSLVFIESVIAAEANFSTSPEIGYVPLEVDFFDLSRLADNWIWYINGDTISSQNPTYIFDSIGIYTISQIAYNTNFWCADTAYGTIKVFNPITIFIPNIITANNDGINDDFTIQLEGGRYIWWQVYNRWGNLVYENEEYISTNQSTYDLWDGVDFNFDQPVTDGVYFYQIIVKSPVGDSEVYTGSLTVVR
ncbi:MAG: gliding motility-associated C-terminal domain-containing protein [Crocinitomicaceae bacterium]|nr:gliding motility-associated C-terminal domain-containing protein [Crocinitomicaceae bacterium]